MMRKILNYKQKQGETIFTSVYLFLKNLSERSIPTKSRYVHYAASTRNTLFGGKAYDLFKWLLYLF